MKSVGKTDNQSIIYHKKLRHRLVIDFQYQSINWYRLLFIFDFIDLTRRDVLLEGCHTVHLQLRVATIVAKSGPKTDILLRTTLRVTKNVALHVAEGPGYTAQFSSNTQRNGVALRVVKISHRITRLAATWNMAVLRNTTGETCSATLSDNGGRINPPSRVRWQNNARQRVGSGAKRGSCEPAVSARPRCSLV